MFKEINKTQISTESTKSLAEFIDLHTHSEGIQDTEIPALKLIRSTKPFKSLHSIYDQSICIIAEGSKIVTLAQESYRYDPATYLVASVHLPICGEIVDASKDSPYLSLKLSFSPDDILNIVKDCPDMWKHNDEIGRGLVVNTLKSSILEPVLRLVKLLDTPNDIPILYPLITREILYRVLQDESGYLIKQFAMLGSHAQAISKVIKIINRDYYKSLTIEALAKEVSMSVSSLHTHFKKVTAMSPLQYQKLIRLQEARRLLLSETTEAADAGFKVGYESPSQFSREYARLFGLPPISDVKKLKDSLISVF